MLFEKNNNNMKDDDELEMLLGEIPRATSSSLNPYNHHHTNASFLTPNTHNHKMNLILNTSNTSTNNHHMYGGIISTGSTDDQVFKSNTNTTTNTPYCPSYSSPVSGFSLQSDGSSSSFLSNGGGNRSVSDIGSRDPSPPQFDDLRNHFNVSGNHNGNGLWFDFKRDLENNSLVDDFNLSRSFSKMYVGNGGGGGHHLNHQESFVNGVQSPNVRMSFDDHRRVFSDCGVGGGGFGNHSVPRGGGHLSFDGVYQRIGNLSGSSRYSPTRPDGLVFDSGLSPRFVRASNNVMGNDNIYQMGLGGVLDGSRVLNRLSPIVDDSFYVSRNGMNPIEAREAFYSPSMVHPMVNVMPRHDEESLLHYQSLLHNGRNNVPMRAMRPQESIEAFTRDDSLILQGEGINYGIGNRGNSRSRGYNNAKGFNHESDGDNKSQESCKSPKMFCPFYLPTKCTSLAKAQGYIYHIAKDQHGCRFLQRMFDEGTSQDVQIIFNEIIDHVVELMMNPFGNYLMQKLLEVCNEEQRMLILLKVTREPGQLVRISLNTHGTRVVQKLIETLKMRQQISLVISALEPGFLALIKDLNGNHVVQRCLQCFTTEDSKFIFVAAAKYCVDIATHQHGCCVLQRCISHSTGELRDALISEISANGLLLSQDAFGNYVVQFILELKIPSATAKLTSQFEGNYVHLATQKFSSHVVEKCLMMGNEETRSKVIRELLSATYFDQLLQDPHANYVVQTALRNSEGPLHISLVEAVECHKAISRNSPYSKRIFSHKLLKR